MNRRFVSCGIVHTSDSLRFSLLCDYRLTPTERRDKVLRERLWRQNTGTTGRPDRSHSAEEDCAARISPFLVFVGSAFKNGRISCFFTDSPAVEYYEAVGENERSKFKTLH